MGGDFGESTRVDTAMGVFADADDPNRGSPVTGHICSATLWKLFCVQTIRQGLHIQYLL